MIRTVPTGDLGLDVLLGGGFRLVTRLPGKASATVLIRGGAGAGKTLVGFHAALELAKALEGDVAIGCVEILPTEYVAQIRGARPDVQESRVAALPETPASTQGPRVFCGLLTELDPDAPDLVASLEALGRDVEAAGGKPVIFVVDSLIEGYGIGASTPRAFADALMKFAAEAGCGLVLCEETQDGAASPWSFAADTVMDLGVEAHERGRWIEVRKHRFGVSVSGRHEIELASAGPPAVFPEPHAWVAFNLHDVLRASGWRFSAKPPPPQLAWDLAIEHDGEQDPIEGSVVLVASNDPGLARTLAFGLIPNVTSARRDLIVFLDPFLLRPEGVIDEQANQYHLPTIHGPSRALRRLVERFTGTFTDEVSATTNVRRIVIGDVGIVLPAPHGMAWMEALRVFASLVVEAGSGVPVIAYEGGGAHHDGRTSVFSTYADLRIDATAPGLTKASVAQRSRRKTRLFTWQGALAERSLPEALEHLDRLARPREGG